MSSLVTNVEAIENSANNIAQETRELPSKRLAAIHRATRILHCYAEILTIIDREQPTTDEDRLL